MCMCVRTCVRAPTCMNIINALPPQNQRDTCACFRPVCMCDWGCKSCALAGLQAPGRYRGGAVPLYHPAPWKKQEH